MFDCDQPGEDRIIIRYLPLPIELVQLAVSNPATFERCLRVSFHSLLGIFVRPGESCYTAWVRGMSEENGLNATFPINPLLLNTISEDPECRTFLSVLSYTKEKLK